MIRRRRSRLTQRTTSTPGWRGPSAGPRAAAGRPLDRPRSSTPSRPTVTSSEQVRPARAAHRAAADRPAGPHSKLKPRSEKTVRKYVTRRQIVAQMFLYPSVCEVPMCSEIATDPHEPLTRARGGDILDAENIRKVCHTPTSCSPATSSRGCTNWASCGIRGRHGNETALRGGRLRPARSVARALQHALQASQEERPGRRRRHAQVRPSGDVRGRRLRPAMSQQRITPLRDALLPDPPHGNARREAVAQPWQLRDRGLREARARAWACATCMRPVSSGTATRLQSPSPGQTVGYKGAHSRVRAVKGSAAEHLCIDCGNPAKHWSYDHTDPDEHTSDSGPFSLHPDRYQPRCHKCHRNFDLACKREAA